MEWFIIILNNCNNPEMKNLVCLDSISRFCQPCKLSCNIGLGNFHIYSLYEMYFLQYQGLLSWMLNQLNLDKVDQAAVYAWNLGGFVHQPHILEWNFLFWITHCNGTEMTSLLLPPHIHSQTHMAAWKQILCCIKHDKISYLVTMDILNLAFTGSSSDSTGSFKTHLSIAFITAIEQ